jgi:hypothetical protein
MRRADDDGDAPDPIAAFLRELAAEPEPPGPLPDPRTILRRARLRERLEADQEAAERVARPILAVGLVGPFVAGLALATQPGATGGALAMAGVVSALAVILGVRLALIED